MKDAVIVHGKPTRERYEDPNLPKPHEANWLPWLGTQLESRGIPTDIPAMPEPYFPQTDKWENIFCQSTVNESTGLVGHSAGAEFLLSWLSRRPYLEAEQLVLVAPYRDEAGKYGNFSLYDLDKNMGRRIGKITIINSLDDSESIQRNAHQIADHIAGVHLVNLSGFGHFMIGNAMNSPEFPELLEVLTSEVR